MILVGTRGDSSSPIEQMWNPDSHTFIQPSPALDFSEGGK